MGVYWKELKQRVWLNRPPAQQGETKMREDLLSGSKEGRATGSRPAPERNSKEFSTGRTENPRREALLQNRGFCFRRRLFQENETGCFKPKKKKKKKSDLLALSKTVSWKEILTRIQLREGDQSKPTACRGKEMTVSYTYLFLAFPLFYILYFSIIYGW